MAKARLIGVDLFRVVAAFAVVVVHASGLILYSDQAPLSADDLLLTVMQVCRFAVPFFLAASFYFVVGKLLNAPEQFDTAPFLKSRVTRLLVPYILWSILYFLTRLVKATQQPEGVALLVQDPIYLIFLGGAAIHLYFLPLLFTGSLLVPLLKKITSSLKSIWISGFFLLGSALLYELLFVTGNSFELGVDCLQHPQGCALALQSWMPTARHSPLIRLMSVELLWAIRCWMFICASVVLHTPVVQQRLVQMRQGWIWLLVFSLATLGGALESFHLAYFPLSLYELGVGYGLLLWGLVLSRSFSPNPLLTRMGNISFGIYLAHYLILVFVFTAFTKLPTALVQSCPPTVLALILATLTFCVSGTIILGLNHQPILRRLLFSS